MPARIVNAGAAMTPVRTAAAPVAASAEHAALEQAAVQFEGLFIAQMFAAMREAGNAWAEDKPDPAAGILDHAYRLVADDIAGQRAFGIADALVAQMRGRLDAPAVPVSAPAAAAGIDPDGAIP